MPAADAHAKKHGTRRVGRPLGGRRQLIETGYPWHFWMTDTFVVVAPTEQLLISGGDSRLQVSLSTGLNAYGCSPHPQPSVLAYGSSTASSISADAYARAERLRDEFAAAPDSDSLLSVTAYHLERIRRSLCDLWGIPGTQVILTPSGTDGETIASCLALSRTRGRVINVLVAPDETGSGAALAACGRHHQSKTPSGSNVGCGDPIAGFAHDRLVLKTIPIRDETGLPLPAPQINDAVTQIVENSVETGDRVLLHLLDCSKTGSAGPGHAAIAALAARYAGSIDVVVDACQARLPPEASRAYLRVGYMVLITGSKFFTGPAFSGALLVPPSIAATLADQLSVPAGVGAYSSRLDWPTEWHNRTGLPAWPNAGLALRWEAALSEMIKFEFVADRQKDAVLTAFADGVTRTIATLPGLVSIPTPQVPCAIRAFGKYWHDVPTIFVFALNRGAAGPLTFDEARIAHRLLMCDIENALPADATPGERSISRRLCHLGQPVRLAEGAIGALRLCSSARTVCSVTNDTLPASGPDHRLSLEIEGAETALRKADLVARYWKYLRDPAC